MNAPTDRVDPQLDQDWPALFDFYPDDLDALQRRALDAGCAPTVIEVTDCGRREFRLQDRTDSCSALAWMRARNRVRRGKDKNPRR